MFCNEYFINIATHSLQCSTFHIFFILPQFLIIYLKYVLKINVINSPKSLQWERHLYSHHTVIFVVCISVETKNTDSFHPGSFELNILMCGSELFAYYLWASAAFVSAMFKHKADSSSLVSHWIPFMKILNLSVNNTSLWLLLICFFLSLNIHSDGLLSVFSCSSTEFCSFCL